jgi:predicted AlkP superfamily phosphohydrolase/phosphomutase
VTWRSVVVIGLDGLDPLLAESMMAKGELPHLDGLRRRGAYGRVATTMPAQTPVAWSTFAVGANPGAHGIFDFLRRDPGTYMPEIALFRHEQKSRFLPPRAVNLRGGIPVWEHLSEAGISSTILRHPCTYPPKAFRGRALAGVGVPDLRGGFGSSGFYSADPAITPGEGEHVFLMEPDASGRSTVELLGPILPDGGDLRMTLHVEMDEQAGSVRLRSSQAGVEVVLKPGRWSPWIHVRFKQGLLQSVRGLIRFHLAGLSPLALFASAIHFDPDAPPFPLSHPWDYAGELRRALGPYATLGMAEEHNGLINGRMDEGAFLTQSLEVMEERRAMMRLELERHDGGLFFCLFDTPDRVQHMFWRFREPGHPANHGKPPSPELAAVIRDHYRECDEVVGEALALAGGDSLVMVLSDHGFASFQREVDLNAWLYRNRYLALRPGEEPGASGSDLLRGIDWGKTRAYAVGMAGLYLNLAGREGEGIVSPSDAGPLGREIASRLMELGDPVRGGQPIRAVLPKENVYRGSYLADAPDLLVGYAGGYRVASSAAMGRVGAEVVADNRRRWSGDHVVDPALVPGVLFMSTPFSSQGARLVDLAPTILEALGVPPAPEMEGASLLP